MQLEEAHTCTLAPGVGACTPDTTDPPNCTELTWAQGCPAAPRSQRFPRRLRQNCQRETRLCSTQVQAQFPGRRSLFRRFRNAELDQSQHVTHALFVFSKKEEAAGRKATRETKLKHVSRWQLAFFLNVYSQLAWQRMIYPPPH